MPACRSPAVPGHAGTFVFGQLRDTPVLLDAGPRPSLRRPLRLRTVTAGIRWMARQGVNRLILTNAAGSLNPDFPPGFVDDAHRPPQSNRMLALKDRISLISPHAYDPAWRPRSGPPPPPLTSRFTRASMPACAARTTKPPPKSACSKTLGADAIGMSTVLETIQARALGLTVAAFSCLTNHAAGISPAPLDHAGVLAHWKTRRSNHGRPAHPRAGVRRGEALSQSALTWPGGLRPHDGRTLRCPSLNLPGHPN